MFHQVSLRQYRDLEMKLHSISENMYHSSREGYGGRYDPKRLMAALEIVEQGRFREFELPKNARVRMEHDWPFTNHGNSSYVKLEDVHPRMFEFRDLEFIPFCTKQEKAVSFDLMRRRAKRLDANFGYTDGLNILADIGKRERKRITGPIVLAGSLIRGGYAYDRKNVPVIWWKGDGYVMEWWHEEWSAWHSSLLVPRIKWKTGAEKK